MENQLPRLGYRGRYAALQMLKFLQLTCLSLLLTAGCSKPSATIPIEDASEPSYSSQPSHQTSQNGEQTEDEEPINREFAAFNAVLNHLLTDAELQDSREFYGTMANRRFALVTVSGAKHSWPNKFTPNARGFEVSRLNLPEQGQQQRADAIQPDFNDDRLLGVRLYDVEINDEDARMKIGISNVGGDGGKPRHIGGCVLHYDLQLIDGTWNVELTMAIDP